MQKIRKAVYKLTILSIFVVFAFGISSIDPSVNGLSFQSVSAGMPVITYAELNGVEAFNGMYVPTDSSPHVVDFVFDTNETALCRASLDQTYTVDEIETGYATHHWTGSLFNLNQGTTYTIYFECETESTHESDSGSFYFTITAPPTMSALKFNDVNYTSGMHVASPVVFSLNTNRVAFCRTSFVNDFLFNIDPNVEPESILTSTDGISHSSTPQIVDEISYTVYVKCADSTGSVSPQIETVVLGDTTPPVISNLDIKNNYVSHTYIDEMELTLNSYPGDFTVDFDINEDAYCEITINGETTGSSHAGDLSFSFLFQNQAIGYRQGELYCRDSAGNETTHRTLSFTLAAPPTPPALSGLTVNDAAADEYYPDGGDGMKFFVFRLPNGTTQATIKVNTDINSFCWLSRDATSVVNDGSTGDWFQSSSDSGWLGARMHSTVTSDLSNGFYYVQCVREASQVGYYIPGTESEKLQMHISVLGLIPTISNIRLNDISYTGVGTIIPLSSSVVLKVNAGSDDYLCRSSFTQNFDYLDYSQGSGITDFTAIGSHNYSVDLGALSAGSHSVYVKCSSSGGISPESTVTFIHGSDNVVAGVCGTNAISSPYLANATQPTNWTLEASFCSSGLATNPGGLPSFPAQGATVSWTCLGESPELDVSCSASRAAGSVVNGVCGSANGATVSTAPTSNLCSTGTANTVTGSGPWSWNCLGSGGGSNVACSAQLAGSGNVDGVCGSANGVAVLTAPVFNLCSSGTANTVIGSGPWDWNCLGSGTGSNVACSAPLSGASQVATPMASHAPGNYTSSQTILLSTTTSGAQIRYTTDGSTPTASSTPYSSSILVYSSKTIKAIAIKSGMTNSAVMSATYTIGAGSSGGDGGSGSSDGSGSDIGDGHVGYSKYHKKYMYYRGIYRNEISKENYQEVRMIRRNNPALFKQWKKVFLAHKYDSKSELNELDAKTSAIFWKYKNYNGYRNYKIYKIKNGDTNEQRT